MAYSKGSLNKVMLIGNIGADPELRTLPDGGSVCNFSIATTEGWVDKNTNEKREQTEWHRITYFGKAAEIIHQYGRKGSKIYVEGMLRTRKWKDRDGNDRYTTEVRGEDFTFVGPRLDLGEQRGGGGYGGERGGGGGGYGAPQDNYSPGGGSSPHSGGFDDMDDDIPF